jgi:TonB family protein
MSLYLRILLFLGLLLHGGQKLRAQPYILKSDPPVFSIVRPSPQGGDSAWFVYLNQQLEFRKNVPPEGMSDTIRLSFSVDSMGWILNPLVSVHSQKTDDLDSALIRAMRNSLPWNPGTINGMSQIVQVTITMHIIIPHGGRDTFTLRPSCTTRFEEAMPVFPGGQSALNSFIQTNTIYPEQERAQGIMGVVYVYFTVQRDGSIADVRTAKEVPNGPGLSKEAERVVKMLPNWLPRCINGRAVSVAITLPIHFSR